MVAQSDLLKVSMLNTELSQIDNVLRLFDQGGRITSMTVSGAEFPFHQFSVATADIDYPPQMIDAIKNNLEHRLRIIQGELESLGVTDIETIENRR